MRSNSFRSFYFYSLLTNFVGINSFETYFCAICNLTESESVNFFFMAGFGVRASFSLACSMPLNPVLSVTITASELVRCILR
jgi:hypothetical protein